MKKRFILTVATILIAAGINQSIAQLKLPRPSPGATVTQTIGLTDITINYSSPGVKGRTIYGDLVPYDKLWRTGANSSTKITFSKDVSIMDNKIPAGTYSLFTIPGDVAWTVILNNEKDASSRSYNEEADLVRLTINAEHCEFRERMMFSFANFDNDKGDIIHEWDKTMLRIPVHLNTDGQSRENIKDQLSNTWREYNSAARYFLAENILLDTGLVHINQSLSLNENWFNTWTKAEIYEAMGNKTEAYRNALKAKELGDAADNFFFADAVNKAVEDWKPDAGMKGKK